MNEATGSSFSWSALLSSAVPTAPASTATLKVNHDNVLAAAKIIQTQIDALKDSVDANGPALQVEPSATDPVSLDAARAWNHRLVGADDSYKARIDEYMVSLQKLVVQLQESAKAYGFSDSDIAATFGTRLD
jgi:PE family